MANSSLPKLGIYCDVSDGRGWENMRVCTVEHTRLGKPVMGAANGDCRMKAIIETMSVSELNALLDMIHCQRQQAAS